MLLCILKSAPAMRGAGQHHDAAVLSTTVGYQNHGETLAYFGKLRRICADSAGAEYGDSPPPENPAAEASRGFS